MKQLSFQLIKESVVIPAGTTDTFPQAVKTVNAMNLKMLYYGWPGMTRTTNGDILVTASEGLLHVDPFRRDVIVRSTDNGLTWSKPQILFDSITDDRDIALNCLRDGTLVATWFSSDVWARPKPYPYMRPEWEAHRTRCKPDTLKALHRGWLRHSFDGVNWDTDNVVTIKAFDNVGNDIDLGYPIALEISPGEIFCIYYAYPSMKMPGYETANPNEWGILSSRFKLT